MSITPSPAMMRRASLNVAGVTNPRDPQP
jgi:hypothetical protein